MVPMHDHLRPHRPRQPVHHRVPRRMAAGRLVRDQDVGSQRREGFDVLRPDRGGGQRMHQRRALYWAVSWTKPGEIVRQFRAAMQPWRRGWRPHARAECAAETGDPHALDLPHAAVQRARRGQWITPRVGEVEPHFGAAIVVVVAMNPVYRHAAIQQRRRQFVQRTVALDVSEQNSGFWRDGKRGEARLDVVPVLMNVADENEGHVVPRDGGNRYHGPMVTLRKPPLARMTLAEFLTWKPDDPSARSWQLIDGEPVAMAPGSQTHGAIQAELGALLRNHLLERGSPCRVVSEAGVVPRLRADRNYRIPDLGVTCVPPSADHMLPDPVLLIEILSPSNEAETWSNVWTYASIPSVAEILVVHSTKVAAELLRRDANGNWPDEPVTLGPDEAVTLESIGFSAPLCSFYRTTVLA